MKLNYDCLRKILLTIESDICWHDDLTFCYTNLAALTETLSDFSRAEIAYASKMAIEANLIEARIMDCDTCIIDIHYYGLSFEGHQFLDTVRENKIWTKTKRIISAAGGASLSIIKEIASNCITAFIKGQLS